MTKPIDYPNKCSHCFKMDNVFMFKCGLKQECIGNEFCTDKDYSKCQIYNEYMENHKEYGILGMIA